MNPGQAKPATLRRGLPRGRHLVTPAWLAALIAGRPVEAAPAGDFCLFDVDMGPPKTFLLGHVPGSGYIDINAMEQQPFWNRLSDAALLKLLLGLGIGHDQTVILYGRNSTAAARAAQLMLYAGVRDVRLLDGGFEAWMRCGLPFAAGAPHRHPTRLSFGAPFPGCPQYLVDTPRLKAALARHDSTLVSIRTWDEFIGRTSGYAYIEARGEIPGAVWGRAGEDHDMNSMSAFQNADGSMKPAAEIRAFWLEAGITPERQVTFYCGTGWRASLAFFYAWLMGWERIAVYDGGWFEWSSDPANPRELRSALRQADDTRERLVQAC